MSDLQLVNDAGQRISVSEDGKISVLARAASPEQRPSALTGPGATDPDDPQNTGAATPLAQPKGSTFPTFDTGAQPLTRLRPSPETPLVREDPIGTVITGVGAAKAGAAAARAVPGLVGAAIEGATVAGVPTLATTGDPVQAAKAVAVGAPLGVMSHVLPDVPAAIGDKFTAARRAKVPTAVTGGATTRAAQAVTGAGDILRDTAEAHPDLQNAILSGNDRAKYQAITGKLDELTKQNDATIEHISQRHPDAIGGRVPAGPLYEKLRDFATKAHEAGDESLLEATAKAIDSVQKFDSAGTISPAQLRGVRNGLAKKVAGAAPLSTVARETGAVKGVLNDALSDLADETPGLKADDIRGRSKQIASLIPAQSFLEDKLAKSELEPPKGIIAKIGDVASKIDVTHPLANVVKPVQAIASAIQPGIERRLAGLAGPTGPAGVAALKRVVLNPTRESLQEAIRVGIPAQVALQVARLGQAQGATQ